MGKYSVRMKAGAVSSWRKTPGGRKYFMQMRPNGGAYVYLNTDPTEDQDRARKHEEDLEYFKSDDLFEVRSGIVQNTGYTEADAAASREAVEATTETKPFPKKTRGKPKTTKKGGGK